MTRLISLAAIAAAALALAAPALADVGRPADAYRHPGDAFAKDAFRAHPGGSTWSSLRPLASTWNN